jgi:molybdopterin molybdotransferase
MRNKLDILISVNKAKKLLNKSLKNKKNYSETVETKASVNRIISKTVFSKKNIPEFDNSAVDGFGFNYNSLEKFKSLKIIGESRPGFPFRKQIRSGEAIVVYTGSYILKKNKIDTVCFMENCKVQNGQLNFIKKPLRGENIRCQGEDLRVNQVVMEKGRKIRAVDIAQLSSLGLKRINVFKKLKIGVFSSGNEIIQTFKKKQFTIFDANKDTLIAMIHKIGCEPYDLGIIKDDLSETKKNILKNLSKYDLIITTGGISTSKQDNVSKFFSNFGQIKFWRLAVKPGRPIAFGLLRNKPFIGLPGNPVAAIVTFLMLITDYLKQLSGNRNLENIERFLPANFTMKKKVGRTEWLRGSIKIINNKQKLERFSKTGSGIISSISKSEGIIEINEDLEYIKKGTLLKFYRYEDILN